MIRRSMTRRSTITPERLARAVYWPVMAIVFSFALLIFAATPSRAQAVQVDLSSTSALCGGAECFNVAGLFSAGTEFLGTSGMDNGNNCTPTPPYTNCPDAYSATAIGLNASVTPPTLTPASLGILFNFGTINTTSCGPSTSTACTPDIVNYTSAGVAITLPAAEQAVYSTMIILGTAVNGSHPVIITATYTDSSQDVFDQTLSDWCGYSAGTATLNGTSIGPTESIAVSGTIRINSNGTPNGPTCNVYAYTLPLNVNKELAGITLTANDTSGDSYALAITLKPPSYTIAGAAANPTSISPGSNSTATVTVNPQTGYVGGDNPPSKTVTLSCSISPTIIGEPPTAATAPTCSLNPTSVTVTAGESAPPTTTLTFTAASPSQTSSLRHRQFFYACWIVPGIVFLGAGLGARDGRRRKLFGLMLLMMLLAGLVFMPACVSYTHLGNVGTPPGQYTVSVTGVDENGLTQASNSPGTTNTVVVTVTTN
jgi:hypothetical protein